MFPFKYPQTRITFTDNYELERMNIKNQDKISAPMDFAWKTNEKQEKSWKNGTSGHLIVNKSLNWHPKLGQGGKGIKLLKRCGIITELPL